MGGHGYFGYVMGDDFGLYPSFPILKFFDEPEQDPADISDAFNVSSPERSLGHVVNFKRNVFEGISLF